MKDDNKNIVLVTWKGTEGNFGTALQCYATYYKLQKLGFSVSLLSNPPSLYDTLSYIKYIVKYILSKRKLLGFEKKKRPNTIQAIKRQHFFEESYIEVEAYTAWQVHKLIKRTNCFVTGSDQIWNTNFWYSPGFFLSFAGNSKRVAYASSIGTADVKDECKKKVKEFLMKFSHIGVREKEAAKALAELTGRTDIQVVIDPTFLLTPEDWQKLSMSAVIEDILPNNYILCYLVGKNSWYQEQLLDVKAKTGLKEIVIVPAVENPSFFCDGAFSYMNAGPAEFVNLIENASLIVTDSFHATALSINHSKSFIEFVRFNDKDKKSQNSRIYNLLERYGLIYRIYNKDSLIWMNPIDYHSVQEKLNNDRKMSLEFLVNSIND